MRDRSYPFSVIARPDVARLWLAGISASVMRWLEMLAFSLFALAKTGSPLIVSLTLFARMLPLLFLGGAASALSEGSNRRRTLSLALGGMAFLHLLLLTAAETGWLDVPLVLAAAVLGGVFWAVETPLRRTMLAEAGGLDRVGHSMGLEIATNQATRFAGALLGGGIFAFLGLGGVFATGAVLYGLALLQALSLHEARAAGPSRNRGSLWSQIREAVRAVRRSGLLLGSLMISVVFNLWALPFLALGPVIAETGLGLGPGRVGMLMAMEPLGALAGALAIAAWLPVRDSARAYGVSPVLFATGVATLALTSSVIPAVAGLLFAGIGMAAFSVMQMVLPIRAAPPEMRVRIVGLMAMTIGMAPLGFVHAGLLAEWLGASRALLLISLEGIAATLVVLHRCPELGLPLSESGRGSEIARKG